MHFSCFWVRKFRLYILYLEKRITVHGKYADKIKMPQFTNVLLFEDCNSVVKGGMFLSLREGETSKEGVISQRRPTYVRNIG